MYIYNIHTSIYYTDNIINTIFLVKCISIYPNNKIKMNGFNTYVYQKKNIP